MPFVSVDKIINEVTGAVTAALKGVDDIITALRTTVKNQITGSLKDAAESGVAAEEAIAGVTQGAVKGASGIVGSTAEAVKGTVSAAIEGALLGIPAIAVSLVTFKDFDFRAAAEFTSPAVRLNCACPSSTIELNPRSYRVCASFNVRTA